MGEPSRDAECQTVAVHQPVDGLGRQRLWLLAAVTAEPDEQRVLVTQPTMQHPGRPRQHPRRDHAVPGGGVGVESGGGPATGSSGSDGGLLDLPRWRPAAKIAAATAATTMPIRTQAHQGSPPLSVFDFDDDVCVAFILIDFELWTDTPPAFVADAVLVCVLVVVRGAWSFPPPEVFVPGSDFAGAVTSLA
jgi:hypothetical protein